MMFDPESGKVLDREALRSIGFSGQGMSIPGPVRDRERDTNTTFVQHETDGGIAGYHTEHSDGRVDATVKCRSVGARVGMANVTPGV